MEHDDGESGFLIKTIQFNGSKLVLLSSSESALFDTVQKGILFMGCG